MDLAAKFFSTGRFEYDGTYDPNNFFQNCHLQANILDWNEEKKLQMLPLVLIGKAKRAYDELENDQRATYANAERAIIGKCSMSFQFYLHAFYQKSLS